LRAIRAAVIVRGYRWTTAGGGLVSRQVIGVTLSVLVTTIKKMEVNMGRGILLWLLGVPIPIIILLALLWH
jgi:hypothetical protein